jgi:2,3-bisphosphoglycerate-independent phosphoglycerate mutase
MHACFNCAGLGMTLGMEWIQVPGTTGSYDSPFHLKAHAICDALSQTENPFDFGFLHVKAVDDCGHDRLWALKVKYLEVMDLMVGQIVRMLHEAEQVCTLVSSGMSGWSCGYSMSALPFIGCLLAFVGCHHCLHPSCW